MDSCIPIGIFVPFSKYITTITYFYIYVSSIKNTYIFNLFEPNDAMIWYSIWIFHLKKHLPRFVAGRRKICPVMGSWASLNPAGTVYGRLLGSMAPEVGMVEFMAYGFCPSHDAGLTWGDCSHWLAKCLAVGSSCHGTPVPLAEPGRKHLNIIMCGNQYNTKHTQSIY